MPNPNISKELTTANKTALDTSAAAIWVILDFLVNLTPKQRKSLRKMATKRTGYVDAVYQAIIAFPSAIPETFNVAEFTKDKVLLDDLKHVLAVFLPIVEALDDTILALGNELMTQSDTCYNYLQRGSKDNAPLTEVVAAIATAFKRGDATPSVVYTIPAGGNIVIGNVVIGSRLVNTGITVIKFNIGDAKAVKAGATEINVEPGNSEVIPKGYDIITVYNASSTVEASFSVKHN